MLWIKYVSRIIFFAICLSIFSLAGTEGRRVNCRKYVFAPVCRGIAAKRIVADLDDMMVGDDPTVYASDNMIPLRENENQLKLEDSQGQWYINDHRRNLDTFVDDKKKFKSNADYDVNV